MQYILEHWQLIGLGVTLVLVYAASFFVKERNDDFIQISTKHKLNNPAKKTVRKSRIANKSKALKRPTKRTKVKK
jgi:hypothetical protein